jgi:hypothetical protein
VALQLFPHHLHDHRTDTSDGTKLKIMKEKGSHHMMLIPIFNEYPSFFSPRIIWEDKHMDIL